MGLHTAGAKGDATVLRLEQGEFTQVDVTGAARRFNQRLALRAIVLNGRLWHDADDPSVGETE